MEQVMKVTFAALLLVPVFSFAGGSYSMTYTKCIENSAGITSSILECNYSETGYQDARLNDAYKSAMNGLSAKNKASLREAQRAWIKYRDKKVSSVVGDGTMRAIEESSVFLEETMRRAEELESLYN